MFLTLLSYSVTAQTASIDSLDVCAAQEVILPVNGASLLNVGAMTLYIGFDTINLTYDTVENIDPQVEGLTVNLMTNPMQIAFAWSNTVPANFPNNKLFDIIFISNGNNAEVHFNANCEISDTNGVVIPTTFLNGAIVSGMPQISQNPSDTTVDEGNTATFKVGAGNTNEYLWRESTDNGVTWLVLDDNNIYSGTKTNQLTIFNTPLAFNNNLYQCVLNASSCMLISASAKLTVEEIIGTDQKTRNVSSALIFPNPFRDSFNIRFYSPSSSEIEFSLTDECGHLIKRFPFRQISAGIQYIPFETGNLKNGVYYLRMTSEGMNPFPGFSSVVVKN